MSNMCDDLIGNKIDHLTIIKRAYIPDDKGKHARYLCKCDCGKELIKRKDAILKMRVKSCGCKSRKSSPEQIDTNKQSKSYKQRKDIGVNRKPYKPRTNNTNLEGQRFGRLQVIEWVGSDKFHKRLYLCRCDCGNIKTTTQALLKRGDVLSCGCLHKEIMNYRNGYSNKRIYHVWINMRNRCNNPNFKQYNDYGGRGIKVCEEWDNNKNGIDNFVKWAYANGYDENAPRGKCTLDRINNDGNYEPSNCRWVDMKVQAHNKRNTK